MGQRIVVDNEDLERIMKYRWSTWWNKKRRKFECPVTYINYKHTRLSRFLINAPKGFQVDHINRNSLDNRKKNLRLCDNSINGHNRGLFRKNKTGFMGVYFDKYHKSYRAEIRLNNKKCFLGYFKTTKEASVIYERTKRDYLRGRESWLALV